MKKPDLAVCPTELPNTEFLAAPKKNSLREFALLGTMWLCEESN